MFNLSTGVRDGLLISRLPPGFRFHPTDEELVVHYLRQKALISSPFPASIIPQVETCRSDPWDFPGDPANERYFFSTREAKYPKGNRSNRSTVSGYWKATGIDQKIVTSDGDLHPVVGMKKTLVFYRGKAPSGSKTHWIMHEYRLVTPSMNLNQRPEVPMGSWVLCRIFPKRKRCGGSMESHGRKKELADNGDQEVRGAKKPVFFEFLTSRDETTTRTGLNLEQCSSISGSSGLTDISIETED
ncbi:hypothetical protein SAY86_025823 [Trapa natans]|uniref:NAC domain-containing protein n=1 Tax=Trapa natans TaxID=22666 RepID=A0AAN7QE99_TRANT|nr:hypothetical protein SAY86_025823 [Trapa natans]